MVVFRSVWYPWQSYIFSVGQPSTVPILQMTDTGVTFPSCYNTVGHARVCVMALTSPPSPSLSRPRAELSLRRF